MQATDRISHWTTGLVAGTAVVVGGGAVLWNLLVHDELQLGLLATLLLGAVAAYALGQIGTRALAPARGSLDDLAKRIEAAGRQGERLNPADADSAPVLRAVNLVLDRVAAEREALRQEAALGRTLVEQSPNGVLIVGPDGRIRYVNPAFRRMVELRGEPEGRQPIEVIPLAEVQQAVELAAAGRTTEDLACSSGRYDLLVRPVRTADQGTMVLLQDVTRFRMAERARTEFVANVSHELRTPIATIMGYAETLADDRERLEPEHAMMADAVLRNARRLRDLFEDLLELSRIEARRRELPLVAQPLLPILDEAIASAVEMAARRNQTLELDCDPELTAMVNAEALGTIIGNLANNATNYTPEGGHVWVRAHSAGKEVVVEVADDGIGIDRMHHERIFERFYRVDEGRSRRVGGTGLGLAIVKHLALASGCRVDVRSESGGGSTFTVHLPTVRVRTS